MSNKEYNSKDFFLSLGGGLNQYPLVQAAKNYGFKTIVVDISKNFEAKNICDIYIPESILNPEAILTKLEANNLSNRIAGIFSRSYGEVHKSVEYIAKSLSLKYIPYSVHQNFQKKQSLKNILQNIENKKALSFLLPKSYNLSQLLKNNRQDIFPLLIKPTESFAKKNIYLIFSEDEFQEKINFFQKNNLIPVIENFIPGNEITILGIVLKGKFQSLLISDKLTMQSPPFLEIAHVYPSVLESAENINWGNYLELKWKSKENNALTKKFSNYEKETILEKLESSCQEIASAGKLEDGPMVLEFKIFQNDLVLIEAAAEVGGEYLADFLLPRCKNYNIFKTLIAIFSGLAVELPKENKQIDKLGIVAFGLDNEKQFFFNWPNLKEFLEDDAAENTEPANKFFFDFARKGKELGNNNDRKFVFALQENSSQDIIKQVKNLHWDRWKKDENFKK